MIRRTIQLLQLICLAAVLTTAPVSGQIGRPEPINGPVKDQWREPFERFLRELGVKDPSKMISNASAFEIGGIWHANSILFRIEDTTVCVEDLCFTAIGRVVDNKFVADTMFTAGKSFTRSDHFVPVFGYQTIPAWLIGEKSTVTLLETPNGWIVISNPN